MRSDLLLDFKDHSLTPEQQVQVPKGQGTQSRGGKTGKVFNRLKKFMHGYSQWLEKRRGKKKKLSKKKVWMSYSGPELCRNASTDNLCNVCVSHSHCSAALCKTCCYYMLYWHVYYFPTRKSLLWPASWSCWVLYSSPGHFKNTNWKIVYKSDTWQEKKAFCTT